MLKNKRTRVGSEEQYGPRLAGEILHDYLENSNEPLAVAYRERLFKEFFPDTHPCVNLKLLTREPGRMPVGAYLDGVITRDGEDHFCFIQNDEEKIMAGTHRNPHIYEGKRINVNRKGDGTLYPTFCRPQYTESLTFSNFCREAAEELLAVAGLGEE